VKKGRSLTSSSVIHLRLRHQNKRSKQACVPMNALLGLPRRWLSMVVFWYFVHVPMPQI
jgi:hypothetical protein